VETGSAVKRFKIGHRVMGALPRFSGMAEEVVVEEDWVLPAPAHWEPTHSAALLSGFFTAYNGLVQRGGLKRGEWVLITGAAGGMGASAIQVAKAIGAKVIACASSQEKIDFCLRVGADYGVNSGANVKDGLREQVHKITKGRLVDVVYDVVGGDVFDACLRCLASHGRLLVVGFASGRIPNIAANHILLKCISVIGVASGYDMTTDASVRAELHSKVAEWADQKQPIIPFVSQIYSAIVAPPSSQSSSSSSSPSSPASSDAEVLSRVRTAFQTLQNRQALGKIVVQWTHVQPSSPRSKL